jgi:7-keto-8-aminopelargonate synthetase-like enzyme
MSVSAGRAVSGEIPLYSDPENRLAGAYGVDDAVITTSGYLANAAVITFLLTSTDLAVRDTLVHSSIVAGTQWAQCRRVMFRHNDPESLAAILRRMRGSFERARRRSRPSKRCAPSRNKSAGCAPTRPTRWRSRAKLAGTLAQAPVRRSCRSIIGDTIATIERSAWLWQSGVNASPIPQAAVGDGQDRIRLFLSSEHRRTLIGRELL